MSEETGQIHHGFSLIYHLSVAELPSDTARVVGDILLEISRLVKESVIRSLRKKTETLPDRWSGCLADVVRLPGCSLVDHSKRNRRSDVIDESVSPAPTRMVSEAVHGGQIGIVLRSVDLREPEDRGRKIGPG